MPLNLEKIDLGGFGINEDVEPQVELQPVSGLNDQVRANMDEALKINPDQHAQITDLSKQSGIPEFAVESDQAKVEHQLKLDDIDFNEMSVRNPNTAKYLTDFNNSVIAQDDIDVLQSLEDVVTTVKDYGSGFDPEEVGDPLSPENFMKPCGRGIFLMRALMDEVEYDVDEGAGTEVRLVKYKDS